MSPAACSRLWSRDLAWVGVFVSGAISSVKSGGARGIMVIVTEYGHGYTSSIPGQD